MKKQMFLTIIPIISLFILVGCLKKKLEVSGITGTVEKVQETKEEGERAKEEFEREMPQSALTIADVEPKLAEVTKIDKSLDPFAKEKVTYGVTRKADYDGFFKKSAITYGGLLVGQIATDDVTRNLQGFARSRFAKGALDDEMKAVVGDTPEDELTREQSFFIMEREKAKGNLTKDEIKYALKMLAYLGITQLLVKESVESSAKLIPEGEKLLRAAPDNFKSKNELLILPKVKDGLQQSISQLNRVKDEGAGVVEELVILTQAMKIMAGSKSEEE